MGKGQIISGGEDGKYSLKILYNRDRYTEIIADIDKKIVDLTAARIPVQTSYGEKSVELASAVHDLGLLIGELESLYGDMAGYQAVLSNQRDELVTLKAELQDLIEQEPPASEGQIEAKEQQISDQELLISESQEDITDKTQEIDAKNQEMNAQDIKTTRIAYERAVIGQELAMIDLELASYDKKKTNLDEYMPEDEIIDSWCADLTEDLTGYVGTIEIPDERSHKGSIQIQPGYCEVEANPSPAVYDQTRDGQLFPTIIMTPAQAFYNLAMLPSIQKWMPIFKHGTITTMTGETASITLDPALTSSSQDLVINRVPVLTGVEFEYMTCDSIAFAEGDEVLVRFDTKDSMVVLINQLSALKTELAVLNEELAVLRAEMIVLNSDEMDALTVELNILYNEYNALVDEYQALLDADPQEQWKIDEKYEKIQEKLIELQNKKDEITNQEEDVSDKQEEVDEKEGEILDKKTEIKAKSKEISNNIADLAEPTVVGFKTHPKICCPYIENFTDGSYDIQWSAFSNPTYISFEEREEETGDDKFYILMNPGSSYTIIRDTVYDDDYYLLMLHPNMNANLHISLDDITDILSTSYFHFLLYGGTRDVVEDVEGDYGYVYFVLNEAGTIPAAISHLNVYNLANHPVDEAGRFIIDLSKAPFPAYLKNSIRAGTSFSMRYGSVKVNNIKICSHEGEEPIVKPQDR